MRKYKNFRSFPPLARIKHIRLTQFRNYGEAHFAFPTSMTGICGPNGTGKTNLLDALYLLCYTKSYFSHQLRDSVQWGQDGFRVEGDFVRQDLEETIALRWRDGKKDLFRGSFPYPRHRDHIGRYAAVMIAPDDLSLINGGSEYRRKWMDGILAQTDLPYLDSLMAYQKALQNRNAWWTENLRQRRPVSEREYYEQILSAHAPYLFAQRQQFLQAFVPRLKEIIAALSNEKEVPSLRYISDLHEAPMDELIAQNLAYDQKALRTTRGLHRDEWEFRINEMPIRRFGSQGQKKTYLFALKLAQFQYLKEKSGQTPFLLLDDLFEKLDEQRIAALLQIIQSDDYGQVFVTHTHAERLADIFGPQADLHFISPPFE